MSESEIFTAEEAGLDHHQWEWRSSHEALRAERDAWVQRTNDALRELVEVRAYIGDSDMMRESIQALQEMIVKQAHQITELERKVQMWKKDKRRERLIQTLIYHQRLSNGKCYCGWKQIGKSHAEHIVIMFEKEEE